MVDVPGDDEAGRQLTLTAAALCVLGFYSVLVTRGVPVRLVVTGVAAVVLATAIRRPGAATQVAALVAALCVTQLVGIPWLGMLPLAVLAATLAARFVRQVPNVQPRLGRVPPWPTIACAAVAPIALIGWVLLTEPDLRDLVGSIPKAHPALLLLGGLAFALWNATFEEWAWRGVIQGGLERTLSWRAAVLVQAASFGIAHAHGFPRGAIGVALAGVWGVLLGTLRRNSRGLLAPILAHIVADSTIVAILLARR